jgi:L-amino acid N-acyltransferase YncA
MSVAEASNKPKYFLSSFHWRAAKEEDMTAVTAIYNRVVTTSNTIYEETEADVERFTLLLEEKNKNDIPFIVATEVNSETGGEEIIGYAYYGSFRARYCYRMTVEHSVYVREDQRGRGLGDCLLLKIMELAKKKGAHVMVGGIDSENIVSIKIHEKHGFAEVGRMPEVGFKKGQWLTLVLMQKIL